MRFSKDLLFAAVSCLVISGTALSSQPAEATEPYLGVQGGFHFWPAYSNREEVEADTLPGYGWALVAGLGLPADRSTTAAWIRERLHPSLGGRIELEVGQRFSPIHGINDAAGQRTGDGKWIQATTAHLNLWPSWRFADAWQVYGGGGGGITWLRALGSDKRVSSFQLGAGVLLDVRIGALEARVDFGWRSFFASATKLRDGLTDFDAHGLVVGVQLVF